MDSQVAITPLARRVAATLVARRLFEPGDCILVAVSGGPDSVALLALLAELAPSWRLRLCALHINHGLRGEESDEDARFVAALCERLGISFRCERIDLGGPAGDRKRGSSLQERAREARYELLIRVGRELGVDKIALGHTADDQAETLLMWMLRGAGTAGLAGIPPTRESFFVRPLLDVTRADILDYLDERRLAFRTDSSNAKPLYLRNRIRQELLPLLKRYNPAVVQVLTRQADILREENHCLDQWVQEQLACLSRRDGRALSVDRAGLLALPLALQRRMVRTVIRRTGGLTKGPTFRAVASVLDVVARGQSGSAVTVQGVSVERAYGWIRFSPSAEANQAFQKGLAAEEGDLSVRLGSPQAVGLLLPVPSVLRWPLTGQVIRAGLDVPPTAGLAPAMGGRTAIFDADRVTGPLLVRTWKAGDLFCPAGMQGQRKKLQDYFADIKLARRERAKAPLLVAPEGVMWVAGYRADHRFLATSRTTRTVTVELLDESPSG
ncbi:MAG: tRNA lysidine(34) synthetase TilS [Nitrospirae bacterium]|nr:tRNA lysidine(34) synthetase TilS [Nitrospirota bacterium]